jgi:ubiquinone/menaquinone biosynthesis C-methylase UbiE
MNANVDRGDLESRVQQMYSDVARNPRGEFHFHMGRALAERLGYDPGALDRLPAEAVESFAGVGHVFGPAGLRAGERVVDLGSGSGMDTFLAAITVGPAGRVTGVDMTPAQLEKAERLRESAGLAQVEFRRAYIEEVPLLDGSADCVISNGVINLSPEKPRVFAEAARLLGPGGRLAVADIVSERPLPETVACDATLWAACIAGAVPIDVYRADLEAAGFAIERLEENTRYEFVSASARNAVRKWGVKSVSLLARKR